MLATSPPSIPVQRSRLHRDVHTLTTVHPPRNHENLASLNYVADYIRREWTQLGYQVEYQTYKAGGHEYKNVVATYGDVSQERVIIGAHYDVCGNQPGADDNASAVAGLLEIGRVLAELKPDLQYGIELVAFTLEEPPYFTTPYMGSAVHARATAKNRVKVRAMICLEMIGYFSDEPHSQQFPDESLRHLYPTTGNFITVVGKTTQQQLVHAVAGQMREVAKVDVQTLAAPPGLPGISLSDHRNYWAEGYPAVMINDSSFYRNPHYHLPSDTIDTLDFVRMTEVVRGVYWAAVHL